MTTYTASPSNVASQLALVAAGDTLLLSDGTYAPITVTKNGTLAAPITIRAVNDGLAIFDGTGFSGANPVLLSGSSYVTLQGVHVHNAQGTDIDNVRVSNSQNCTLRRVTADTAGPGNANNIAFTSGSHNGLAEDCGAWERGRYSFLAFQSNNVTLRRCWARRPHADSFAAAPRNAFGAYDCTGVTAENCIVAAVPLVDVGEGHNGTFITSNDTVNFPANTIVFDSCIFLDADNAGMYTHSLAGVGNVFRNCMVRNPLPSGATTNGSGSAGRGDGLGSTNPNGLTLSRCTIAECDSGVHHWFTTTGFTIDHCSLYANTRAVHDETGNVATANSNYSANGALGITLAGSDKTLAPGYDTATYGKGAYLMRPLALTGTATDGSDMGCSIVYQLVDGVTTTTPLWPWPMEARILAETAERGTTAYSPTYAANGGLWLTLTGIYPVPYGLGSYGVGTYDVASNTTPAATDRGRLTESATTQSGGGLSVGDSAVLTETASVAAVSTAAAITATDSVTFSELALATSDVIGGLNYPIPRAYGSGPYGVGPYGGAPIGGGGVLGSGGVSAGTPKAVIEVSFTDPTSVQVWQDISHWVERFAYARGRQRELDLVQAGTLSVTLINTDRRFDPSFVSSPYYPNVRPTRRIRIGAAWGGVTYPLWSGYVESWEQSWQNWQDATVTIQAADAFKPLNLTRLTQAFPVQQSGLRVNAVLDAMGWTVGGVDWTVSVSVLNSSTIVGPTGDRLIENGLATIAATNLNNTSALQHLQDVASTELGLLFASREGAVAFYDRAHGIEASQLANNATFGELELPYVDVITAYDDTDIWNDVRVTAISGIEQVATDLASQKQYYRRTLTKTSLHSTDLAALSQANMLKQRYSQPVLQVVSMTLDGNASPDLLYPQMFGRELGDRVVVRRRPPGGGSRIDEVAFIQGVHLSFDASDGGQWLVTWRLAAADPRSFWILGDSTYGVLGTAAVPGTGTARLFA